MVARTCLSVALHELCLPCLYLWAVAVHVSPEATSFFSNRLSFSCNCNFWCHWRRLLACCLWAIHICCKTSCRIDVFYPVLLRDYLDLTLRVSLWNTSLPKTAVCGDFLFSVLCLLRTQIDVSWWCHYWWSGWHVFIEGLWPYLLSRNKLTCFVHGSGLLTATYIGSLLHGRPVATPCCAWDRFPRHSRQRPPEFEARVVPSRPQHSIPILCCRVWWKALEWSVRYRHTRMMLLVPWALEASSACRSIRESRLARWGWSVLISTFAFFNHLRREVALFGAV
jgi:hypothetical protein